MPLCAAAGFCVAFWLKYYLAEEELVSLREEKEQREASAPQLVFSEARWTPWFEGNSYKFHVLQIWLKNRPDVLSQASTAENVSVTVRIVKQGSIVPFVDFVSQWIFLPDPDLAVTGMLGHEPVCDIPANDNPAKMILLLRHVGTEPDRECYAHSFGKLIGSPDGRYQPFRIDPGVHRVSLVCRGRNIEQSIDFRLDNTGPGEPRIEPRDADGHPVTVPAIRAETTDETPVVSGEPSVDVTATFEDETLILSIRNDGPTDSFVVQLRYLLGANPCGTVRFVFPVSLRWKGQTGEQRDIITGQIQHVEVLKACPKLSEDRREAFVGPLTLLTATCDVAMQPNWFVPGKLADGLHLWLDIAGAKNGTHRAVPLDVHLACAGLQMQRVVCHLVD